MKKSFVIAAASLFAAGTIATAAHADGVKCGGVKCGGVNACKGQSARKGTANSCKGLNACKGQGWAQTNNSLECTVANGKLL